MSKDFDAPLIPQVDTSTSQGMEQESTLFHDAVSGLNASGKVQKVPVADLSLHPDNPREQLDTDTMVASYRHRGYVHSSPVTVSKRADGSMFVLRGNRRTAAAQVLQQTDPETFKKVFPDGKVPCLVLTGLTLAEEIALLIDHGAEQDRRKLSKREELTAMRKLLQAGIKGREAIARALDLITRTKDDKTGKIVEKVRGPYVQPRLALLSLPEEIQTAYADSSPMFGGDDARFAQKWILGADGDNPALAAALSADRKAGMIGPDGFGPALRSRWEQIKASEPEARREVERWIAESKATALLQACKSHGASHLINVLAGFNATTKLSDVDASIMAAEAAQRMLANIAGVLGSAEFAALCDKADKFGKANAEKEKEKAKVSEENVSEELVEATA